MDSSTSQASTIRWSFSLKDALFVVAVIAVLLAPYRWFGKAYLVSMAFSVGLVLSCVVAYMSKKRFWAIGVAVAGAAIGLILVMGLLVFFGHALLNVLVCIPLVALNVRPRVFAAVTTATMASVYGFAIWQGMAGVRELQALKARYPLESLEDRLAFERRAKPVVADAGPGIQLAAAVLNHLDEQDDAHEPRYYSYSQSLRELHEQMANQFARAAGFGIMRMPTVQERLLRTTERKGLVLPIPVSLESVAYEKSSLFGLHTTALYNFISPDRIGYVLSRAAVAGFDAHGFAELTERLSPKYGTEANWQVIRLELVSLLRYDEPQVYVTESLPQMDDLAEVPHRGLNGFEAKALPRLKMQDDIVVEGQSDRIQMLGALRAGRTCLECHDGERGKLLGAFSYELVPVVASESTRTETSPVLETSPMVEPSG